MKKGPIFTGLLLVVLAAVLAACSDGDNSSSNVLYFSGIPDQNVSTLARRYQKFADYMEERLGVEVKFKPSIDYSPVVTAFEGGDIQLGWFGGLTGVQARIAVPDSVAIAQRPRDAEFHSKFIVRADLDVHSLEDLRGLTFTFGSESSTSGHLMPRHFLVQAGVDPEDDFRGGPNYSGSHDKTWKLVESGAYQAGALNEAVWESAVSKGRVDLTKVRVLETTPPYFDYNWTIRGDVEETFGEGFIARVREALLSMGPEQQELLDLFSTDGFIETNNDNYATIRDIAKSLDIVR